MTSRTKSESLKTFGKLRRGHNKKLKTYSPCEPNVILHQFHAEVQHKKGDEYEPGDLHATLDSYLKNGQLLAIQLLGTRDSQTPIAKKKKQELKSTTVGDAI